MGDITNSGTLSDNVDRFTYRVGDPPSGSMWPNYEPPPHTHHWEAVAGSVRPNIKGFDSLIQSCHCGEARRVEVPA